MRTRRSAVARDWGRKKGLTSQGHKEIWKRGVNGNVFYYKCGSDDMSISIKAH